jgi:hypothetical protein
VLTELALERVEFTCGRCWRQWSTDYDVQHYRDDDGRSWEYFFQDGIAVGSPYTPEGAPPCPECGRHWVGHIVARRQIPTASGPHGTPRQLIADTAGYRQERHDAPPLRARDHSQPSRRAGMGSQSGIE